MREPTDCNHLHSHPNISGVVCRLPAGKLQTYLILFIQISALFLEKYPGFASNVKVFILGQ